MLSLPVSMTFRGTEHCLYISRGYVSDNLIAEQWVDSYFEQYFSPPIKFSGLLVLYLILIFIKLKCVSFGSVKNCIAVYVC